MKRAIYRLVYRLRADNNARCMALWALTIGLLFVNLIVFGFGPVLEFGQPDEYQRAANYINLGRDATDSELAGLLGSISSFFGWSTAWLRWGSWTFWGILLFTTLAYTPIAFRDEVGRGLLRVAEVMRERREDKKRTVGVPKGQPATPPAPTSGGVLPAGPTVAGAPVQTTYGRLFGTGIAADFAVEALEQAVTAIAKALMKRRT